MMKMLCTLGMLVWAMSLDSAWASTPPPETAAPLLFTLQPTASRAELQQSAEGRLAALLAEPANVEVTMVTADPSVVSDSTKSLAVRVPGGKLLQFDARDLQGSLTGIDGWVGYRPSEWKQKHPDARGEIDIDPLYSLSLVRSGDKLMGSMLIEGVPYSLEYLGPKQYALIKIDEKRLPPDTEVPLASSDPVVAPPFRNAASTEPSIIRVLLMTSNQGRQKNPTAEMSLALALQDANQYMQNSQVGVRYQLAGYHELPYDEGTKASGEILNDIEYSNPEVARLRDFYRADLVSMLIANGGVCGAGKPFTGSKIHGFSVISCLPSLAHELGHNLGGRHNWKAGDELPAPPIPSYAFGYYHNGSPSFRTQMSYDTFCTKNCPRVPFFSNPRLTYQGVALGTAEHHDVSRYMNDTGPAVSNFYPDVSFQGSVLAPLSSVRAPMGYVCLARQGERLELSRCPQNPSDNLHWRAVRKLVGVGLKSHGWQIMDKVSGRCIGTAADGKLGVLQCPTYERADSSTLWQVAGRSGGGATWKQASSGRCLVVTPQGVSVEVGVCNTNSQLQQWIWPAFDDAPRANED